MKHIYIILFSMLLFASCKEDKQSENTAEEFQSTLSNIEGEVNNNPQVSARINIMGYFVDPIYTGRLAEDGVFEINLPTDFAALTQQSFESYNMSDNAEFELAFSTAIESFPNTQNITFTGKQSKMAFAGKYYRFEFKTQNDALGYLYPASSPTFINHVMGKKNAVPEKGHHYFYIYAIEPFAINGTHESDYLFEDGSDEVYQRTDQFEINVVPGWNLIKYEVLDLTSNSIDSRAITETKTTSITNSNEALTWWVSF